MCGIVRQEEKMLLRILESLIAIFNVPARSGGLLQEAHMIKASVDFL